jgi:hypothetical protein
LAGGTFGIAGVAFQQAFVGIALDVGAEDHPALLIEQIEDQAFEFGGILDLVLGFTKYQAEQAMLGTEVLQS